MSDEEIIQEEGMSEDEVPAQEDTESRIPELEAAAEELRNQVATQEAEKGRLEHLLQQTQASLETAVTRYRDGILRDNPEIPGHLLTGSTVEELDASLEEARTVIDSVRQHLEEQVPAGAPARTGVDVNALSPRQKIEYGVTHGQAGK